LSSPHSVRILLTNSVYSALVTRSLSGPVPSVVGLPLRRKLTPWLMGMLTVKVLISRSYYGEAWAPLVYNFEQVGSPGRPVVFIGPRTGRSVC
jgi:hypothetical protein